MDGDLSANDWEGLRTLYASRMPRFLQSALPGIERAAIEFVPHHVAHAASAYLCAPFGDCAVIVADGRGEHASYLAGKVRDGRLTVLATQSLPHSLGLLYEELTVHLGFHRSSDEYKVMGLAGYGKPRFLDDFRSLVRVQPAGGFSIGEVDFTRFAPRRSDDDEFDGSHADLAASVQARLEEVLLELGRWVNEKTADRYLAMAGGVALNCVANARMAREGPFERVWAQPASGDAGTSLGAALFAARKNGDRITPMRTAALGREWSDEQIAAWLDRANVEYERPADIARAVAEVLADDGVVGWFQGRSEFGPRALGHRSLLANPRYPDNLERLNNIKGREQFRPVAPMVLEERAAEIFEGQLPSPYMLFTHTVKPEWREAIAAAVHVDGTARVQTVNAADEPLVARMLREFDRLTGVPVTINTSFNTAGRPMVDDPRDALECFGSSPVDALAIGPYLLRRAGVFKARPTRREVASGV
jgi:carbamoyltransferase